MITILFGINSRTQVIKTIKTPKLPDLFLKFSNDLICYYLISALMH